MERRVPKCNERKNKLSLSKKHVFYLDETWIHAYCRVNKCWQDCSKDGLLKNKNAGKRWIIVYTVSGKGFVPGSVLTSASKSKKVDIYDKKIFSICVQENTFDIFLLPLKYLIILLEETQDWLTIKGVHMTVI